MNLSAYSNEGYGIFPNMVFTPPFLRPHYAALLKILGEICNK
jgi:hypothetical protein